MRKLLYRGQTRKLGQMRNQAGDKLPGIWVYGGIFPGSGVYSIIYGGTCEDFTICELEKNTVYSDTVGQYTGMPDKNKKLIYEGDIVRDESGTLYQVVWSGTGFYLKYDPPHAHGMYNDLLPLSNYWHAHGAIIEVVGNIHDNPELLKKDGEIHE